MRYNIENEDKLLSTCSKKSQPESLGFEAHSDAEENAKDCLMGEVNQENESITSVSHVKQSKTPDDNEQNIHPNIKNSHDKQIKFPYRIQFPYPPKTFSDKPVESVNNAAENLNSDINANVQDQNTDNQQTVPSKNSSRQNLTALIFSNQPNAMSKYLNPMREKSNSNIKVPKFTQINRERNPVRKCQNRDLNKEINEMDIYFKKYKVNDDDKIVTDTSDSSTAKTKSSKRINSKAVLKSSNRIKKQKSPQISWDDQKKPSQTKVLKQNININGKQIYNSKRTYSRKSTKSKIERSQKHLASSKPCKKSKKIRKETKKTGKKMR